MWLFPKGRELGKRAFDNTDDPMKTIWIVSEGSPGHVSQSVGLVEAIKARVAVQPVQVFGRMTARGWARSLIRAYMGKGGRALPSWLLPKVAKIEIPDDAPAPDLIVSSGGKSVVAARTWAQNFGVPYVFIGYRSRYPAGWFHTVISHVPGEWEERNAIAVELIPTPVTPALIAAQGSVEPGTWCMIIGGATRTHPFTEQDWSALADGMNRLAREAKIKWLLTTSRRTGIATECLLRERLDPLVLKDSIWWSEQPRRELYQFMARSEVLFVTQDSVTMVTEAVSSGKPVIAVLPSKITWGDGDFKLKYFKLLEKKGRIAITQVRELPLFSTKNVHFNLLVRGPLDQPVEDLIQRLGWLGKEQRGRCC